MQQEKGTMVEAANTIYQSIVFTKKSTKTLQPPTVFLVWPFLPTTAMLKKALTIDEKVHGQDRPDTCTTCDPG
jgi:hypothetical protein